MENKNIGLKILKVMDAIGSISKDGKNNFHGYRYVTDAAIVSAIRVELIKNKLVVIPNQIECIREGEITTLKIEYTLLDAESGETIVSHVYGQGQDKGDKQTYKAATGAEKYYLMKTFLIPTDDDPENERAPVEPRKRATKEDIAAFDKSMPPKEVSPYIGNPEALTLFQMLKDRNIDTEVFRSYLSERGIEGTNKILRADYENVYAWIIKMGPVK